jgi:hypothetical protein
MVYLPEPRAVSVDLDRLSGSRIRAWWYDPRDGTATAAGERPRGGVQQYQPPEGGPDWILVLDDVARGYEPPGS